MVEEIQLFEGLFYPSGLENVALAAGSPVFSSQLVASNFLSSIKQQKILDPIFPSIASLVHSGDLIPCYSHTNILSYIVKKTFANRVSDFAIAFFDIDQEKIFVIMDLRYKKFWASENLLSATVIHELMHYCFKKKPKTFRNVFDKRLLQFYTEFIYNICGVRPASASVAMWLNYMFSIESGGSMVKLSTMELNLSKLLKFKVLSPLSSNQASGVSDDIMYFIRYYATRPGQFFDMLTVDPTLRKIYYAAHESYKMVFGIYRLELPIEQEFFFPSEVIAKTSELKPTNDHFRIIKMVTN